MISQELLSINFPTAVRKSPYGCQLVKRATVKCCRKLSLHYNGLLYCGTTSIEVKLTVLLRSHIKGMEVFLQDTPRRESAIKEYKTTTSRHYGFVLIWSEHSKYKSGYCSTQAVVRPTSILPSPSPTPAANNKGYAQFFGDNPP